MIIPNRTCFGLAVVVILVLIPSCINGDLASRNQKERSKLTADEKNELDVSLLDSAGKYSRGIWQLLKGGADPNVKDSKGRTPLHLAAQRGNKYPIDDLVEAGADINAKDKSGRTPLHYAVDITLSPFWTDLDGRIGYNSYIYNQGQVDALLALLALSPDVNAKDNSGDTPLLLACAVGLEQVITALVDSNADVAVKDNDGRGVFHHLIAADDSFFSNNVSLLLSKGADINAADAAGDSPVVYAMRLDGVDDPWDLIHTNYKVNVLIEKGVDLKREKGKRLLKFHFFSPISWGLACQGQEAVDDAMVELEEKLAHNDSDAESYFELGTILILQKRYDDAIKCFESTIRLNKRDFAAYFNIAHIIDERSPFLTQIQVVKAIEAYEHYLSLTPNDEYSNHSLVKDELQELHKERGRNR